MKQNNLFKQTAIMLFSGIILFSGCKKDKDQAPVQSNTITDIVVSGSSFSTLESAVLKADLQATLSGTGPFTVFAPDNAAFAASGITTAVLNSLTPAQVQNILLYHTIGSKILAADV